MIQIGFCYLWYLLITVCAKLSSAVYCNRSCLWVCLCVCLLPRYLEIACIDPHQTGFVGKCSDHLQLIKFWPSRAPGKGVCGGAKFFLAQPYYSQRAVFASLWSLFFIHFLARWHQINSFKMIFSRTFHLHIAFVKLLNCCVERSQTLFRWIFHLRTTHTYTRLCVRYGMCLPCSIQSVRELKLDDSGLVQSTWLLTNDLQHVLMQRVPISSTPCELSNDDHYATSLVWMACSNTAYLIVKKYVRHADICPPPVFLPGSAETVKMRWYILFQVCA